MTSHLILFYRSLVAAVELIQNNAKDLGVLQRKIDSWNAQGLDDREINLRAKDEQLKSKALVHSLLMSSIIVRDMCQYQLYKRSLLNRYLNDNTGSIILFCSSVYKPWVSDLAYLYYL